MWEVEATVVVLQLKCLLNILTADLRSASQERLCRRMQHFNFWKLTGNQNEEVSLRADSLSVTVRRMRLERMDTVCVCVCLQADRLACCVWMYWTRRAQPGLGGCRSIDDALQQRGSLFVLDSADSRKLLLLLHTSRPTAAASTRHRASKNTTLIIRVHLAKLTSDLLVRGRVEGRWRES